jgi:hypothetical protein
MFVKHQVFTTSPFGCLSRAGVLSCLGHFSCVEFFARVNHGMHSTSAAVCHNFADIGFRTFFIQHSMAKKSHQIMCTTFKLLFVGESQYVFQYILYLFPFVYLTLMFSLSSFVVFPLRQPAPLIPPPWLSVMLARLSLRKSPHQQRANPRKPQS